MLVNPQHRRGAPVVIEIRKAGILPNGVSPSEVKYGSDVVMRAGAEVVWEGRVGTTWAPGTKPRLDFSGGVEPLARRGARTSNAGDGPGKTRSVDARESVSGGTPEELGPRPRGLESGTRHGVEPTAESIRVGDVRMEDHPEYPALRAELASAGFEMRKAGEARVALERVVDENGAVIEYRRYMNVIEGMRFLDFEHEMGHVRQLLRFGDAMPTDTFVRDASGAERLADGRLRSGTMTAGQNAVFEYQNRVAEWIRIAERGGSAGLLKEHGDELDRWRMKAEAAGLGRSAGRGSFDRWAQTAVPDLPQLEARAMGLGLVLGRRTWRWS